jgi:hypothetical protein
MEAAPEKRVYFIDANSLLECSRRFNDLTRFSGVWGPLENLISDGRLLAPQQVADEAAKQSVILAEWIARVDGFAVPTADLWDDATSITRRFSGLAGDQPGTAGDPWLIALAVRHTARPVGMFDVPEPCFVVTEESDRKKPQRITRITEVCAELGISYTNLWGMFELEGWRVGLISS